MKKFLVLVMALVMVSAAAYSQVPGEIIVGAKLGYDFAFNSAADDGKDALKQQIQSIVGPVSVSVSDESLSNFGFGVYGAYGIMDNLSVQVELNYMLNQGVELSATVMGVSGTVEATYSSVDIPVLVKYTFLTEPLFVGAQAGPQLSIPIGDLEMALPSGMGGGTQEVATSGITFGALAGVYAGYPVGPGWIVADLRFLFDFNALEVDESGFSAEILSRRGLIINVGYEISF